MCRIVPNGTVCGTGLNILNTELRVDFGLAVPRGTVGTVGTLGTDGTLGTVGTLGTADFGFGISNCGF